MGMTAARRRKNRILAASLLALLAERAWNAFWPLACGLFVFLAAIFSGLAGMLGNTALLVFLFLSSATLIVFAAWGAFRFRLPTAAAAERGIERQNNAPHRPLAVLRDRPAAFADAEAYVLWAKHAARAAGAWEKLKAYRPEFDVARHDRLRLRYAAPLLLALSLLLARGEALPRLFAALSPDLSSPFQTADAAMDIWIEPPAYTGARPAFLSAAKSTTPLAQGDIAVPENSVLKLRLSGYRFAPHVTADGRSVSLQQPQAQNHVGETALQENGALSVRPFLGRGKTWQVNVIADRAPEIAPELANKTAQGALKISYRAADDYGIQRITATLRATAGGDSLSFDIPAAAGKGDINILLTHTEDLTASALAGSSARLTLTAEDEAGHRTESAPLDVFVPERSFTNPAAKALVLERKRLALYDNGITRRLTTNALVEIINRPAAYKGDPIVFMSLAIAAKRLNYDGDAEAVASVQKLLWDVALRIDDGGFSMSARDLAAALQNLSRALDDKNVSQQELQRMMEDVQKKMRAYVQSLAAELAQRMDQNRNTATLSPELAAKFMQHIDMNKVFEQMRLLAEGGTRDQMRQLAEMLRGSVENLDLNRLDQMKAQQQQAMQGLEEMQKLIESQQSLMDLTGRLEEGDDLNAVAEAQDALHRALDNIAERIGGALPALPDNFGKAGAAMDGASGMLRAGSVPGAVPQQKEALKQLQQGMDDSVKQMAEQMQQQMMSFGFGGDGGYGRDLDPLGRPGAAGSVKIPDEAERRRVQEIIRELRNRSNDYQRPKVERDYLDRLLDSFN